MQITMQLNQQQLIELTDIKHQVTEQSLALLLQKIGLFLQKHRSSSFILSGPHFKLNALLCSGLFKRLPVQLQYTATEQTSLQLQSGPDSLVIELLFDQFGWIFHCAPLTLPVDCEFMQQYRNNLFSDMSDMQRSFNALQRQFTELPRLLNQLLKLWLLQDQRQLVIFGTGAAARYVHKIGVFHGLQSAWSDNNTQLHGHCIEGLPVIAPALLDPTKHFVMIISSYFPDISTQLQAAGWLSIRDFNDGFALYTVLPAITQHRIDPKLQEPQPYVF